MRFDDGTELERDGILAFAPLETRDDLAAALGLELTDRGIVDVDAYAQTTVAGVWAAGDVGARAPQVAAAVAQGSFAAAAINDALVAAEHAVPPMMPRRDEWSPAA